MSSVVDPTDYVVRTRFEVLDEVPGLGRLQGRLGSIDQSVRGIAGSVTGRLGAAFTAVAGSVGLAQLTRGIVGINRELQNAELGIGTLFSALGRTDMASAIGQARIQVRGLREDAAKGVGELSDYVQGFQMIFGPAASAGATVQQIRELNKLALSAGFALRGQEGLKFAPLDIQQALTAGVGDRTTPIVNQALQTIGVTNAQFNAMRSQQRIETLTRAFGSFKAAAEAMGASWDARMATFRDGITDLARTATRPLFERWNEQLAAANDWIAEHQARLSDIADRIGPRLVRIYEGLGSTAPGTASGAAALGAGAVGARGALALAGTGPIGALVGSIVGSIVGGLTLALTSGVRRWPELAANIGIAIMQLGDAFGGLWKSLVGLTDTPFLQYLGAALAWAVEKFVLGLTSFVRGLSIAAQTLNSLLRMGFASSQAFAAMLRGDAATETVWRTVFGTEMASMLANVENGVSNLTGFKRLLDEPTAPSKDPPVTNNNFNFTGPVTVTVQAERLDDPNTVATTFDAILRALAEYPTQARGRRLVPKPL